MPQSQDHDFQERILLALPVAPAAVTPAAKGNALNDDSWKNWKSPVRENARRYRNALAIT
jgi:hypothetical protein